ncbi:hypothetical protein FITA111629_07255 [Filibacter tadaridae]|uniref:Cytochrome c oxidase caa3 assembly factor (Caa3_CtaG) n=1 Tax=Filibacter tadaridae TaxID=2483811 RepID=A0A3P5WY13_9BACL|nr:hypothetical protein [Filibacter tadaridae]VDC28105.1 hypothetical protein FILTAD_01726 [Filibacter tadaridae]
MKQARFGLLLFLFLLIPPVAHLLESIMIIHMHMQMPLLVIAGFLMAPFFQKRFPRLFENWNHAGIPGILLVTIVWLYWMIPRTMDDALTVQSVEAFKFFSLPFLVGVPLRDSWKKIGLTVKKIIFIGFTILFFGMGILYIKVPVQLCNNYLLIEQITLGWGFVTMAICIVIYLWYFVFMDHSKYE